ncbi:MAG TPA: phosphotransferase [Acidimicrobiales bacterium]|nr:phosphotransferase [Acidimicrobiales bacterium]
MLADVDLHLRPRPVAASVEELLADASRREPFQPAQTRSTVGFERVWIKGETFIVKYLHVDDDCMLRSTGDLGCRTLGAFAAGLFDVADEFIDHTVVAVARGVGRNGWGSALLMRDVSRDLVAVGDDPFPEDQHASFIDHLAAMCARTWGWHDDVGLLPYALRWTYFDIASLESERRLGWPERVPKIAAEGWSRFAERAPADVFDAVAGLRRDIAPLGDALAGTPSCFLHGDWKASNLGTAPDGRTVLIDWVYLGEGPACHELGWYLALNRAKLPAGHLKERAIEDFRVALERHGVPTGGWWERQLHLSLLGTLVQHGWEKALGDDDELRWWCERAREGMAEL